MAPASKGALLNIHYYYYYYYYYYPILLGLANYHRNYNILLFLYFKPTLVVTILAVEHQKYFNW